MAGGINTFARTGKTKLQINYTQCMPVHTGWAKSNATFVMPRINHLMEFSRQTTHVQLTAENQMGVTFGPPCTCVRTCTIVGHTTTTTINRMSSNKISPPTQQQQQQQKLQQRQQQRQTPKYLTSPFSFCSAYITHTHTHISKFPPSRRRQRVQKSGFGALLL